MREQTRQEIDCAVRRTLREAGLRDPPIKIEDILEHLAIDRAFYDLEDPSLMQRFMHKIRIGKRRLIAIKEKIRLAALWLPDEAEIWVDSSLHDAKKEWASFHDSAHTILEWHRPYFLGDTAQTLNPDFQEMLEEEANYGASGLMFGGETFTAEALDTDPCLESVFALKKRYRKSILTTLRRFVAFSHDHPMAMLVSSPHWEPKPADQQYRWRHFVGSDRFRDEFSCVGAEMILAEVDANTTIRTGGPVGNFVLCLPDVNGDQHAFFAESFYNKYNILTLVVHERKMTRTGGGFS